MEVITEQQTIRSGYKQTEVGVIPEDWDERSLGELGQFKNGINKGKEEFGHGFPFVNLMDVFGIPKLSAETEFGLVNSSLAERKLYELRIGDILFVRSSVKPEGVGLTTLVPQDLPDTVFSGFLIRFRDSGHLALGFKEHCFGHTGFRHRLVANSTVSANTNINQDALKTLRLAFPAQKEEQRAIAAALSDVDALVALLDKLISKKRDLKQAAMQQLLTGKRRLPNFARAKAEFKHTEAGVIPKEWDSAALVQLSAFITKGSTPTTYGFKWEQTGVLFLRSECVSDEGLDLAQSMFISPAAHSVLHRSEVCDGDILITITGNVGRVVRLVGVGTANLNQHIARIRVTASNADAQYIYHFLSQPSVRGYFMSITTGQAYPQISLQQVREAEIPLPPLPEQRAIAAVLSDMDAEIAALEKRHDKTKALKQGMMQELLTGKTRLI